MSGRDSAGSEVRYGRIPLWLYDTGVPLQSIATYGWLHGRYGHFDQVMPSYGTLAKELHVSRGSVITYVKALVAVGALRIKQSGAADHSSNTYEIAFDAPFAIAQVEAGQSADQSEGQKEASEDESANGQIGTGQRVDQTDETDGRHSAPGEDSQVATGQPTDQKEDPTGLLVSLLTGSGQPADQAGQPAVHDIDVFKQTDRPPPPAPSLPPRLADAGQAEEAGQAISEHAEAALAVLDRLPATHRPGRGQQEVVVDAIAELLALGWPPLALVEKLRGPLPTPVYSLGALLRDRLPIAAQYTDPGSRERAAAAVPALGAGSTQDQRSSQAALARQLLRNNPYQEPGRRKVTGNCDPRQANRTGQPQ